MISRPRDSLRRRAPRPSLCVAIAAVLLAACGGESVPEEPADGGGDPTVGSGGDGGPDSGAPPDVVVPEPEPDDIALGLPAGAQALLEGGDPIRLPVALARGAGADAAVTLAVEAADGADAEELSWRLDDETLGGDEEGTVLEVSMPIAALPRQPGTRALRLIASDARGRRTEARVELALTPTSRPDVYLLAGQSNMIGSSGAGARQSAPGEADAPDPRIVQLNVTGNDTENFSSPADFTDRDAIAAPDGSLIVPALDPLHDGYDVRADTKEGTAIGLGLSFAKRALERTTADIVLVPAAWSDTGFCRRDTNPLPGLGWLPEPREDAAFAGTLLHDRAIARTDLALAETGGILRGILWHQGEADSDEPECAAAYAENLAAMVASLRTNISPDARGPSARGADAEIPFVLGTMSKGLGDGGALASFSGAQATVDAAHREVAERIAHAAVVDADDLVPPAWPCGQGNCIHFGAAALRELGVRYHDRLRETLGD